MEKKVAVIFVGFIFLILTLHKKDAIERHAYKLYGINRSIAWKGYGPEPIDIHSFSDQHANFQVIHGLLQEYKRPTFTSAKNFVLPETKDQSVLTETQWEGNCRNDALLFPSILNGKNITIVIQCFEPFLRVF